jgi:hypothetical protein
VWGLRAGAQLLTARVEGGGGGEKKRMTHATAETTGTEQRKPALKPCHFQLGTGVTACSAQKKWAGLQGDSTHLHSQYDKSS